ncbi:MAG: hypothetical protein LBP26_06015 [Clostridiales bacterium]|jgi:hypothetical protein|nr:hypothetical protein [Clostridiales bacterium]
MTIKQKGILKIAVLLLTLAMAFQLFAACKGKTDGDGGDPQKQPGETPVINVPVVDMDIIDTYLEVGKPVTLLNAVDDKTVTLSVTFTAGESTRAREVSASEIGYNEQTTVWTPSLRNEIVEIALTATNSAGYSDAGSKKVFVTERANIRPASILNEQVYIGEEINLRADFVVYKVAEAVCNSASVVYMDGDEVREDNTKGDFNASTMRYTVTKAGEHRISVTVDGGLNRVTKQFRFIALDEGSYIELNYLDDLMGTYTDEQAPLVGLPTGLPAGLLAKNATLKYKLMRDLDYLDPDSWVDGVIKPWTHVVAGGIKTSQEAGTSSVFSGIIDGLEHRITNLTNVFPGRSEAVTVTRTWSENGEDKQQEFTYPAAGEVVNPSGFAFLYSPGAGGAIRNLAFEYQTVLTDGDYTAYGGYSPLNLGMGSVSDSNFGAALTLSNIDVNGSIEIDAESVPAAAGTDAIPLAGVALSCRNARDVNADVDITLRNMRSSIELGGVFCRAGNYANTGVAFTDITYTGDISVEMAADGYNVGADGYMAYVAGFNGADVDSASRITAENIVTSGSIAVETFTAGAGAKSNLIFIGGITAKAKAAYYGCDSDTDIAVNAFNAAAGGIGGLFGENRHKLYWCNYTGGITVGDFATRDGDDVGAGGIVGTNYTDIYDCAFYGSLTLGGAGYKTAGGIAGCDVANYSSLSNPNHYITGCVAGGDVTINGGGFVFGGIIGKATPGASISFLINQNLYDCALTANGVTDGAAAGVVGCYGGGTTSGDATLVMSGNDIYGGLGAGAANVQSNVLLSKFAVKQLFPTANSTGKKSVNTAVRTNVAGYEGQNVTVITAMYTAAFNVSLDGVRFYVEAQNNRHSPDYPQSIRWIGALSDAQKQELQAMYQNYCANLAAEYVYVPVGANVYATMWQDEGLVETIDGAQYLKIPYRDYAGADIGKFSAGAITVLTPEQLEAARAPYQAFINKLIEWTDEIAGRQDAQPQE